jgi:predicted RNase H-like HicB family nuclease
MSSKISLWFSIRPSVDVDGDWEAHCLQLDLVAQGQSRKEALELAVEAAEIHLAQRESDEDERAPEDLWPRLCVAAEDAVNEEPEIQIIEIIRGKS